MTTDLDWPECSNARDLGGLHTSDGRVVRAGRLIRSDNLSHLSTAGIACLRSAAVSRVIDLRRRREARDHPTPFYGRPMYMNIQIEEDTPEAVPGKSEPEAKRRSAQPSVVESYLDTLLGHPREVASVLAAINSAPEGAVVFHCDAGKDRTGSIAALVLTVLGVPRDDIVADYAYSFVRMRSELASQRAAIADPVEREEVRRRHEPRPETMLEVLAALEDRYGAVESYLKAGGFDESGQVALRARLLCD